ncbi:hypothetical protein jhhlp_003195 [Lomentospora prolificans]|uniref:Trafficking protein particle complex subunit 11 domain-containing protein n=1 Tax=Lomentospora prolificans TaxID=41688 RepID=A0A2N3NGE6_9PEZI|nr:hypothetical protein jhhlp_003195 [Lomentospora prolificans]
MDGYPPGSLDPSVPFLVASGLLDVPSDGQIEERDADTLHTVLSSDVPSLSGKNAEVLHRYLASIDATQPPWTFGDKKQPYRFRVESVGRSYALPPRHATLPENIEKPETEIVLHSPLSPLSPSSKLYPDGLINPEWLRKHQDLVPSIYLCFYTLTSDQSRATLLDNQLKTDINAIKAEIARSGYKTKLAVALMSDTAPLPQSMTQGIQERLENIRKGTGLDTGRSIFYIAPRESPDELTEAADTILTALYPQSVEYYRDLGRHARKKRSRGITPQPTIPPTSGTSQTLSLSGWQVRYDFKAAVFSEFRQEIDAAMRAYEQAYDGLLSEDVWDLIPSWSPRWNEARLLSDIIAVRVLRCFLWNEQPSMAVSRWQAHRDRIGQFVDHRGRGTSNYGWKAWETRWSLVMANLMERIEIAALNPSTGLLFLQPEKGVPRERLYPWELLHHTGYWYRQAAWHTAARRALAYHMPEDARQPPANPSTDAPANAGYSYDTYMCPEPWEEFPIDKPGVDYSQLIIDCLMAARGQFHARGQNRLVAEVSLECARESAKLEQWEDVIALLRPVWEDMPFRKEGWTDIVEDVNWTLRAAAVEKGLGDLVLAIDWELLHKRFTRRKNWTYDLSKSLEGVTLTSKPCASLADDTISSFLSASFAFRAGEGKAGEAALAQLIITSDAFKDSSPVQISSLKVEFEGSLKTIWLTHDTEASGTPVVKRNTIVTKVPLKEQKSETETEGDDDDDSGEPTKLCGSADLVLGAGQCRVYDLAIPLREPGEARASSVLISLDTEKFRLDYSIAFPEVSTGNVWVEPSGYRRTMGRLDPRSIQVQPRPPKMDIKLVGALEQYYANEAITLDFGVENAEDEDAIAKLDIHAFGEQVPAAKVKVLELPEIVSPMNAEASKLAGVSVGTIKKGEKATARVVLDEVSQPMSIEFSVRASYHLASDPGTRILQKESFTVKIVSPFEANYELVPRLHLDPWPSLFDPDTIQDLPDEEEASTKPALGLAQKWCLMCHYASFATEELLVVELDAQITSNSPGIRCVSKGKQALPGDGLEIQPRGMKIAEFDIMVQKLSLDDRSSARVEVAFMIKWKRPNSSVVNTTTMLVPPYTVLSTEPRVLASLSEPQLPAKEASEVDGLVNLDITIENPSSHFLTFGLTMEPSDEFAFSGSKKTTVHVLPVSRRTTTYRLLPLVRGAFIRPGLAVRDKYFQKVLRIIPTEGMKADKEGLLVWIPDDEDETDEV